MSVFQSNTIINKPASEVYDFLADLNNHQQLMPEDEISEWSSTVDTASFSIRNMIKLFLKVEDRVPHSEILIIPSEKPPFDLELKWSLAANDDRTEVSFSITAELDMMMKMLASGPLQKLADDETGNLAKLLN